MKYDILLKGGTVIDPTQKLHDQRMSQLLMERLQQSKVTFLQERRRKRFSLRKSM